MSVQASQEIARQFAAAARNRANWKFLYNVMDYGAKGDGRADDTSALQRGLNYVAENGGILFIPAGTYRCTSALTVDEAEQPFTIVGAGAGMVTLVRDSDSIGNFIIITECDNFDIRELSIECNNDIYPNGGHGIALGKCNNVLIQRVNVRNWKDTAIIHVTPDDGVLRENVVIDNCTIDGLNAANNGFLLSTVKNSGIQNSKALNIGKTGSPCYGLQLKNTATRCWIDNCVVSGASAGVAFGQELSSVSVTESRVSDISIFDCTNAVLIGYAEDCTFTGLNIDMNNANTHALSLASSNYNSFSGINVQNMTTANRVVTMTDSNHNSIEIDMFRNPNNTSVPIRFQSNSANNYVLLKKMTGTQPTYTQSLVTDTATDSSNVFEYGQRSSSAALVIASDAVRLPHGKIAMIEVDTEGSAATDNLATINGGVGGQVITIQQKVNARDITIKHGVGNILLNGMADYAFTGVADAIMLIYNSTVSSWCEVGRGNNV